MNTSKQPSVYNEQATFISNGSAIEKFIKVHKLSCAIRRTKDDAICSCGRDQAVAELADLRSKLTIKTLENIKGSSVLDEKNAELVRLREAIRQAQFQLNSTQRNWDEECLFECNDILKNALQEPRS